MSGGRDRLSAMIDRLIAQRDCIGFAARRISTVPGVVLEVGLGKGRTYDRLRHVLPDRDIFVFDREVHCPHDVRPPPGRLFLGDFKDTLRKARLLVGRHVALAHADFGSNDRSADARLAQALAPLIGECMVPGGLVMCDHALAHPQWTALRQPTGSAAWPYYLYQVNESARDG